MARQTSSNFAGLRAALVLGSVAASVIGGRLVTDRDAAVQAAKQSQESDPVEETAIPPSPQPTPTPKIIIIYDLPPVPTAITTGGGQMPSEGVQINPVVPPPPAVDTGAGGGGGGGGKPKPAKKSKSS
jgi:hypothetical protein